MKSIKSLLSAGLLGVAAFAVGCGGDLPPPPETAIDVTIDVNGNTGETIDDAYFGIGSIENQPFTINEDENGDGNLDVFEDLDFDNNLDVAEDANGNGLLDTGEDLDGDGNLDLVNEDEDGDGVLDFTNEDSNDNGILETELLFDINQDGIIDANDSITQTFMILVSSSGEVTCDSLVTSLQAGDDPIFSGTLLATIGLQFSLGSNIPNAFRAGQTVVNVQGQTENIIVQSVFGNFENGLPINNSNATGDEGISIAIETLGEVITANVSGDVVDDAAVVIPFTAAYTAVPQCAELSAELQIQLESGNLFN